MVAAVRTMRAAGRGRCGADAGGTEPTGGCRAGLLTVQTVLECELGLGEVGLGRVQLRLERGGVEFAQRVTGRDLVADLHRDRLHGAGVGNPTVACATGSIVATLVSSESTARRVTVAVRYDAPLEPIASVANATIDDHDEEDGAAMSAPRAATSRGARSVG